MAIQTQQLSEALPGLASLFRAADAKGASAWQVIRWSQTSPEHVSPNNVERPDVLEDEGGVRANRFESRTEALRYSKPLARRVHAAATERGHWGVWEWVDRGKRQFQSVAPIILETSGRAARSSEFRGEVSGGMVRITAECNRYLREIASEDGISLQSAIDSAVKEYYRNWFHRRADAAYDVLREDRIAWKQELDERRAWDTTLLDGIECDEEWTDVAPGPQTTRKLVRNG